jgi:hypothetical protein
VNAIAEARRYKMLSVHRHAPPHAVGNGAGHVMVFSSQLLSIMVIISTSAADSDLTLRKGEIEDVLVNSQLVC